jgi:hypothetical protein
MVIPARQTGTIKRHRRPSGQKWDSVVGLGEKKMKKDYAKAPDLAVTLSDNSTKRLSEFWQERQLVLVFLRHFG